MGPFGQDRVLALVGNESRTLHKIFKPIDNIFWFSKLSHFLLDLPPSTVLPGNTIYGRCDCSDYLNTRSRLLGISREMIK